MTRRAVDFVTEWMSRHLAGGIDARSLAQQLEIDATLVGIARSDMEEDVGPLEDFVAHAQMALADVVADKEAGGGTGDPQP